MTTDHRPDLPPPIEGHILQAEAYPRDEETITFDLMYSESLDGTNYRGKRFEIAKDDAETLAKRILQIIAEPDTQTAWENIAKEVDEKDHDVSPLRPYLLPNSLPPKDS